MNKKILLGLVIPLIIGSVASASWLMNLEDTESKIDITNSPEIAKYTISFDTNSLDLENISSDVTTTDKINFENKRGFAITVTPDCILSDIVDEDLIDTCTPVNDDITANYTGTAFDINGKSNKDFTVNWLTKWTSCKSSRELICDFIWTKK